MHCFGSFHDKFVCGGWLGSPLESLFSINLIALRGFVSAAVASWTLRHLCFEKHLVDAMNQEITAIEKNQTWELDDLPRNKARIAVKWVYKTKLNEKGEVEKHKARLVAKGFSQQFGVNYGETFAPVARLDTVRTILSTGAQHKQKVYQLDVKSAFLSDILQKEVYVEKPPHFEVLG